MHRNGFSGVTCLLVCYHPLMLNHVSFIQNKNKFYFIRLICFPNLRNVAILEEEQYPKVGAAAHERHSIGDFLSLGKRMAAPDHPLLWCAADQTRPHLICDSQRAETKYFVISFREINYCSHCFIPYKRKAVCGKSHSPASYHLLVKLMRRRVKSGFH